MIDIQQFWQELRHKKFGVRPIISSHLLLFFIYLFFLPAEESRRTPSVTTPNQILAPTSGTTRFNLPVHFLSPITASQWFLLTKGTNDQLSLKARLIRQDADVAVVDVELQQLDQKQWQDFYRELKDQQPWLAMPLHATDFFVRGHSVIGSAYEDVVF